jgi:hypothetical protein
VIAFSASACIGQESTTAGNVNVFDLTFYGCTSGSNGGALLINSGSIFASISDCTFANCRVSGGYGRAVYFYGAFLEVLQCFFSDSYAQSYGSCLYGALSSSKALSCSDVLSIRSDCYAATWWLFPLWSSPGDVSFERSNVSGNTVTYYASAILFERGSDLRFQLCEIRSNTGPNCILF